MTIFNVLIAGIVVLGTTVAIGVVGVFVLMWKREDKDRSLIPWGARARVERARASAEVAEMETRREAADIQRLALEPMRQKVVKAIETGEPLDELPALNAGSKNGDDMRNATYVPAGYR